MRHSAASEVASSCAPAKPEFKPGSPPDKQRRQAEAVTPVHEPIQLAFEQQRAFGEADAQVIAGHCNLLAVKIAAVDDGLRFRERERVVGGGIEFALDDLFDVPERLLKRAENLRRAADGIRVLDFHARFNGFGVRTPLVLVNFLLKFRMRPQMRGDARGNQGLPAKTARLVNLLAQHFRRRPERLKQTRGEQLHPAQELRGFAGGERGEAGHRRGAVDERETFLALKRDGLQTVLRERVGGGQAFFAAADMAQADETNAPCARAAPDRRWRRRNLRWEFPGAGRGSAR